MKTEKYTRKDYMTDPERREKGEEPHRRYYSQFVNQRVKSQVQRSIGLEKLLNSTCPHFNDIPLQKWYDLNISPAKPMEDYGDYLTLAGQVCIAKEAATQIVEEYRK